MSKSVQKTTDKRDRVGYALVERDRQGHETTRIVHLPTWDQEMCWQNMQWTIARRPAKYNPWTGTHRLVLVNAADLP